MTLKFLQLTGVTAPPGAPVVVTPLGRAMGSLPGLVWAMDPGAIGPDDQVINGIDGARRLPDNTSGSPPATPAPFVGFSTFANGRPAILLSESAGSRRSVFPNVPFPAAEWSFVTRIELTGQGDVNSPITLLDHWNVSLGGSSIVPRMGFSATGGSTRIWSRGNFGSDDVSLRRLNFTAPVSYLNRPVTLMFSLSAEHGLAIWENGVRVGHAPSDDAAMNAATAVNQYRLFRNIVGRVGFCGIAAVDYSRVQYNGARQRLFDALAAHYA